MKPASARWALLLAGGGPPVVLAALLAAGLALEAAGRGSLWTEAPVTLSEAAGTRDPGMVLRLLWAGGDPRAAGPVRDGVLNTSVATVTPFVAAVATDRVRVLHVLEEHGARLDEGTRRQLLCFAEEIGARDSVEYLAADLDGPVDCASVPPVDY